VTYSEIIHEFREDRIYRLRINSLVDRHDHSINAPLVVMKRIIAVYVLLFFVVASHAQPLEEILERAKNNYPLLKAKRFESAAGEDQVRYVKSAAIPSVEAGYQVNYSTYNNITGMATAQHFVPISGPPSVTNSSQAVLGSAGGLLVNWELLTFGQRKSKIGSAKASLDYQKADEQNEIFQHQVRTANAYLDLLVTNELVKVHQRNLSRSEDNVRIVRALSASGLRPGVDTAFFQAEFARAKIDLLNYERLQLAQQLQLSELSGDASTTPFTVDSSYFSRLPVLPDSLPPVSHPLVNLSTSKINVSEYERTSLQRSLYPKLSLWGTAYGRGSGIRYDGYVNSEEGLSFSRYNYGIGVVLSVPLLQFTRTQYQIRSQSAQIHADTERLNATNLHLATQTRLAEVTLTNSLKIAGESPAFFSASSYAYKGMLSRYNSGLLNYTELIQAQYILMQSEADLRRAYVEAWKALLFKAAVHGDLNIFIDQL
jgi:outer membrane protein TolC